MMLDIVFHYIVYGGKGLADLGKDPAKTGGWRFITISLFGENV
jgi:hypothetical protein